MRRTRAALLVLASLWGAPALAAAHGACPAIPLAGADAAAVRTRRSAPDCLGRPARTGRADRSQPQRRLLHRRRARPGQAHPEGQAGADLAQPQRAAGVQHLPACTSTASRPRQHLHVTEQRASESGFRSNVKTKGRRIRLHPPGQGRAGRRPATWTQCSRMAARRPTAAWSASTCRSRSPRRQHHPGHRLLRPVAAGGRAHRLLRQLPPGGAVVPEDRACWNCPASAAPPPRAGTPTNSNPHSEFYADFGSYDVRITVPKGYTVGATGMLAGKPVERAARPPTATCRTTSTTSPGPPTSVTPSRWSRLERPAGPGRGPRCCTRRNTPRTPSR